jgi:hypothetical protein
LQIFAALHQYPSASELPTPLQLSCLYLPSRQSTDHVDENTLFGSTQMSGLQNISLQNRTMLQHNFNHSIVSLTIHSVVQGLVTKGLTLKKHCIADKIYLLDVDAWVNAKLQCRRANESNWR